MPNVAKPLLVSPVLAEFLKLCKNVQLSSKQRHRKEWEFFFEVSLFATLGLEGVFLIVTPFSPERPKRKVETL